jgi:arylsulfatase A-like enzyme/Tfp pilus assembly protein PilF
MRVPARPRIVSLLIVLGWAFVPAASSERAAPSGKIENPPNVLLITIDTLRPDRLSCYDASHSQTPRIDRLAARGARFTRAFAHTPETLPSHANILLGTTPLYHGVHGNNDFVVGKEFLNLAEHLRRNGRSTGAFVGAFPLDSRFGLTRGFDVYDDNYGTGPSQEFTYIERRAGEVVDKALAWLRLQKGPWFLWVHCFDPHQRYAPPEPFASQYRERPYDGEVAYVDSALGRLLDFLEKGGLDKTTFIVFTGDHGEALGEHGESTHGYFAYNSTLWVPLIIAGPGIGAATIGETVCHVDLFPTVCELAGLKAPPSLQGLSLVPLMKGKGLPGREIYVESLDPYYGRGWAPLRGFIRGRDKFLDSPVPELFDIGRDFNEAQNLAGGVALDRYRADLDRLMKAGTLPGGTPGERKSDRETRERLGSLGYLSSPQARRKTVFTARDDLKALLPCQNKLMQAMGAYHKGDFAEGIRLLKEVIAERDDFDLAYSYLGTLYKEQRRLREAAEILRRGLERCPESYKIITTFGITLTEAGEYDAALELFDRALGIMDYDPEVWNYIGVARWKKGDLDKALESFRKCLELDADYPTAFNNIGSVFLSRYLRTKDGESLEKARESFEKAIELDPKYASAFNGLGGVYLKMGKTDQAIACWKKVIELEPGYGLALYNLGLAYIEKGDREKALESLKRYREKNERLLSPKEKEKLDALIQSLQKGPRPPADGPVATALKESRILPRGEGA